MIGGYSNAAAACSSAGLRVSLMLVASSIVSSQSSFSEAAPQQHRQHEFNQQTHEKETFAFDDNGNDKVPRELQPLPVLEPHQTESSQRSSSMQQSRRGMYMYQSSPAHRSNRPSSRARQSRRRAQGEICSCSPRSYTVTLNLLNDCSDDTIDGNGGVESTDCTIQFGDPQAIVAEVDADEGNFLFALGDGKGSEMVADLVQDITGILSSNDGNFRNHNDNGDGNGLEQHSADETNASIDIDEDGNGETDLVRHLRRNTFEGETTSNNINRNDEEPTKRLSRQLQDDDDTPVAITSITLVEINPVGDTINFNDTLAGVNFINGSSFTLTSISADLDPAAPIEDQIDRVPAATVLFMIGVNSAGEEVRGRFVIRYTNSCDPAPPNGETVGVGDVLAWNVWTDVDEQLGVFCPANGNVASEPPTASPTFLPTFAPTPQPLDPTYSPTVDTPPPTTVTPTVGPTTTPPTFSPTQPLDPTFSPTVDTSVPTTVAPTPIIATPTLIPTTTPPTFSPTQPPLDPTFSPTTDTSIPTTVAPTPIIATPTTASPTISTFEPTYIPTGFPTYLPTMPATTLAPNTIAPEPTSGRPTRNPTTSVPTFRRSSKGAKRSKRSKSGRRSKSSKQKGKSVDVVTSSSKGKITTTSYSSGSSSSKSNKAVKHE